MIQELIGEIFFNDVHTRRPHFWYRELGPILTFLKLFIGSTFMEKVKTVKSSSSLIFGYQFNLSLKLKISGTKNGLCGAQ
jgi:hypothetical protein